VSACIAVASLFASTSAEAESTSFTWAQEVSISGEPASAFIVTYATEGGVNIAPATILRTNVKNQVFLIGRAPLPSSAQNFVVLLGTASQTGEVASASHVFQSGSDDPLALLDTATLKSTLEERRTALKSWETQSTEQAASLERLQEDADVIANVGRIVDAEDELGAIRADIERLSASLQLAQERISALKSLEAPSNFQRREAELSSDLNKLSTAVKSTEASALQKVSAASSELQQKVALIEATKSEHIDLLQRELDGLRKERAALESRVQVDPR
jgi:hypothetical protein